MAAPETDLDSDVQEEEKKKPRLSLEVKVDKAGACKRHVTVTVPRQDIDRYFKDAYDELQPKAEVPGFRPGRAPRKLVESRFREQMSKQVKGSLLMDSVTQINEEGDFSAISEPDFDFEAIELPKEGPMTFEFDIEVRPEFDVPQWKGLHLTRPGYTYSDKEVDDQLRRILSRYGRLVAKDGPAEADDHVTFNVRFHDGDSLVSEVQAATVQIKPKLSFRDATLEGFDKLVCGAIAGGHLSAKVKVSDQAEQEELRGKELDASFELTAVKRMDLPELTPAFLDRIGGFEDEDDLREAVRHELERQLAYYQQRHIRQQITAQLTRSANWELPAELLHRQANRELERAVLELRASGFSDEVIRAHQNELRQNSRQTTERAMKEHFIFERIAESEGIDAAPEDYETEVRLIAQQSEEPTRRVRARLEKRGQMDALRNQIIERKVISLITSHAVFTEIPFEPQRDDTAAIDHAVSGHVGEVEIPEAKYGGEAEQLPGTTDRA